MNSLVNRANKQVVNIKKDLSSLREALTTSNNNNPNTTSLSSQLSASLSGLQATIRDLETLTRNEADSSKREDYKEKVKLLQTDYSDYRNRFDLLKQQFNEQERIRNREELSRGSNSDQSGSVTERLIAQREDEVLSTTSSRLDEFISIGMATISDLRAQKSTLKSSQKGLFATTASLGISESLMKIIGQRSNQERTIFYCGVFCTLLVIFLLWKFF